MLIISLNKYYFNYEYKGIILLEGLNNCVKFCDVFVSFFVVKVKRGYVMVRCKWIEKIILGINLVLIC